MGIELQNLRITGRDTPTRKISLHRFIDEFNFDNIIQTNDKNITTFR